MSGLRVAALQVEIAWEDPPASFRRLEPWIDAAAGAGARLVVLPEMFACGFSMATERVAEPVGGPTTEFLRRAAERHGLWVAGSLPELEAGAERPANALLLVGPGGELHRYRKLHPFSHAGEDRHYRAGEERVTVAVEGVRLTLFVCYDLRFANQFWAAAADTDAYLVVANWPEARREHWRTLLAARAIENQAYVVGVNRVGEGGGLRYAGDSRIVDPMGRILAAGAERETLLVGDLDPAEVAETRRRLPFLADRRAPAAVAG